jgi:ABC-type phosphate transport system substrate-binding protein
MAVRAFRNSLQPAAILCLAVMAATAAVPASKNMAVVVATGSKLSDVALADLAKLCKGAQKSWPDGKNFILVMKSPESPEMRLTVLKLFGDASGDIKAAIAKVNEMRASVKIVGSEEDLLRTVEATPGTIGIVDVYAINSSVKVLRVDGKLPFDVGYAFRSN